MYAIKVPNGKKLQYTCVFWDFEANNGTGGWSTDGVTLAKEIFNETTNSTHVTCESVHLTSFVVLVQVVDVVSATLLMLKRVLKKDIYLILHYFLQANPLAFDVLTYIGCSVSLFCLVLSIIFFISLRLVITVLRILYDV